MELPPDTLAFPAISPKVFSSIIFPESMSVRIEGNNIIAANLIASTATCAIVFPLTRATFAPGTNINAILPINAPACTNPLLFILHVSSPPFSPKKDAIVLPILENSPPKLPPFENMPADSSIPLSPNAAYLYPNESVADLVRFPLCSFTTLVSKSPI